MSDASPKIPDHVEPATKIAGGVRVPAHSADRPSEHKPKEDSVAAKLLEQQEKALIAQNAKALSDQLFEIDDQQHQQRTGHGKGVASTYNQQNMNLQKGSGSPKLVQHRQINQPGGGQACNKF